MLCVCIARIRLVIHINKKKISTDFLLNPNFLLAHRNRYSEGMDDRQMTTRGYPNLNSYVKNLFFCIPDAQLDGQKDREINLVWASLTTFLQVKIGA